MNALIINKATVKDSVLDGLAQELPVIIANVMEVPGGNVALVKPENVSLEFSQASPRDVGSDIRISIFARKNAPRSSTEKELAKEILDGVLALVSTFKEKYSVDIRLYLMDIAAAEHTPEA
ncbi:MAG: hypothetical protein PHI31_10625 [Desulfuromonadaceae bacterium]|nr:hypothetical protein [Desulfuromonadaceae bacterium]